MNITRHISIGIAYSAPAQLASAQRLAQQLCLPLIELGQAETYEFILMLTEQRLELHQLREGAPGAIYVDFLMGKNAFRSHAHNIKSEMLCRAVQIKNHACLNIIDATAGLGRDAFLLASLGHNVTLLERDPIIGALLADGLTRLKAIKPDIKMHLMQVDAHHYLQTLTIEQHPNIIYLDPMFPERTKSALVKKDMRLLQQLLGEDNDADPILSMARRIAKHRIIVKRPRLAPYLANLAPTYSLKGKVNRFDIYQPEINIGQA